MARQDDFFVVDGVFHTDLPVAFSQVTDEMYGVPSAVFQTADGNKIVTTTSPQILDYGDYRDYYHRRKIHSQAWKADWGDGSLMTVFMAEHLRDLYETQTKFWIQYDDEMSRCWGRMIGLNADLEDALAPHAYFTPHYPIFPYGHEPTDDFESEGAWDDHLRVANRLWEGAYSVYGDYGLVLIDQDGRRFNDRIKVHLKYTWRAYVRIKEIQLQPFQLAQTYYSGSVIFEQIAIPITGVALEWKDPPYIGTCVVYAQDRIRVFAGIGMASVVTGTRYQQVVPSSTPTAPLSVSVVTHAQKTSGALKYGSTVVSPVVISAFIGATSSVPTVQSGGAVSSGGGGWTTSTPSKTASQVLSDNDESTYIYGSTFSQKFKLSSFEPPLTTSGHTIRTTWRRGTGSTTNLTVRLMQGIRVVASPTFARAVDDNAEDVYVLTSGEAGSITDYDDLYLEFYADFQAVVTSFELEMPVEGGLVVKTREATGIITVQATAEALRPPQIGYPVLAVLQINSATNGIVAQKLPEPPPEI